MKPTSVSVQLRLQLLLKEKSEALSELTSKAQSGKLKNSSSHCKSGSWLSSGSILRQTLKLHLCKIKGSSLNSTLNSMKIQLQLLLVLEAKIEASAPGQDQLSSYFSFFNVAWVSKTKKNCGLNRAPTPVLGSANSKASAQVLAPSRLKLKVRV